MTHSTGTERACSFSASLSGCLALGRWLVRLRGITCSGVFRERACFTRVGTIVVVIYMCVRVCRSIRQETARLSCADDPVVLLLREDKVCGEETEEFVQGCIWPGWLGRPGNAGRPECSLREE